MVGGCAEAILTWTQQAVLLDIDLTTGIAQWCYVELEVRPFSFEYIVVRSYWSWTGTSISPRHHYAD
jgi:hypothetical protein